MRSAERAKERRALVREAGLSRLSTVSVLAGVLVAYGAVLVLLALAAGAGSAVGIETDGISDARWRDLGVGAAVALAVVLFASYFFGGYVAGRMGRRSGATHGLVVFALGLILVAVVAAVTASTADGDVVGDELRDQGIPTDADDWRDIGLFGGIGLVVAMLAGSVLGGLKGERWHGVLVTRALDPEVAPRGADPVAVAPDGGAGDQDEVIDLDRHGDDTVAIPAATGDGGATTSSSTVHRDERPPSISADDGATRATPLVLADAERQDEERSAAQPFRAGDSIDLTEAERTAAARQDVEAAREAGLEASGDPDETRSTRRG